MTVALIFPPLVISGFGTYYPSLPVLSATLMAKGHKVKQLDLNEDFAEHMISSDVLRAAGLGIFPDKPDSRRPTDMPSVAARLLQRHKSSLYTAEGKHRFADRGGSPAFLMSVLAQRFVRDIVLDDTIALIHEQDTLTRWYEEFYQSRKLDDQIPNEAKLIGLSVAMGPQLFPTLVLVEILRKLRPAARIVLGGSAVSLMNKEAIARILSSFGDIDGIVQFEGEGPLLQMADQLASGIWEPGAIGGMTFSDKGVAVTVPPNRGISLNEMPAAYYDPEIIGRLEEPELGVVQTRGCYWGRCAYCDFVELYEGSPKFRGRSPESFVAEIEDHVERHGARRFTLVTEAIPPSFALKFSNAVVERGIEIKWNSFAMVDTHFTPRHFEAMVASGCEYLVIGLETMNDRVLKRVHKFASGAQNAAFIKAAYSAGIALLINLIPDLPTTTYDEAMDSLRQLEDLRYCLSRVAVYPFEVTRSSQIGREPEKYGLRKGVGITDGVNNFAENHLEVIDDGMTLEQRSEIHLAYQDFANRVNAGFYDRDLNLVIVEDHSIQSSLLRVQLEDVDICPEAHQVQFFNWKTRERWVAPMLAKLILDRAATLGSTFTLEALVEGAARPDRVMEVVNRLVDKKVVGRIQIAAT